MTIKVALLILSHTFLISEVYSGGYDITLEKCELTFIDPNYVTVNEIGVKKVNRTAFSLLVDLDLLQDLPNDTNIEIKTFAQFSNEYRAVPLVIKRNLCNLFNFEFQFVRDELQKPMNHFPSSCPIKKDNYYIKDLIPNGDKFPAAIPWKKIMFQLDFSDVNFKSFAIARIFSNFDRDSKLTKKFG